MRTCRFFLFLRGEILGCTIVATNGHDLYVPAECSELPNLAQQVRVTNERVLADEIGESQSLFY